MKTTSLNLAALPHAAIIKSGKNKDVDCLLIPIELANLFKSEKGGVYLNLIHFEMKDVKDYGDHIVKQSFSKEVREKMTEEQKKAIPIIGNSKFADTGSSEASAKTYDGEGDLTF